MDYVYGEYLPAYPVQALILEAAWNKDSLATLDKTFQWASEHAVRTIVMRCVPEYDAPLAQLVTYSIAWKQPRLPSRHLLVKDGELEPRIRALVEDRWHFQFVSLYDVLCQGGVCKEYADPKKSYPTDGRFSSPQPLGCTIRHQPGSQQRAAALISEDGHLADLLLFLHRRLNVPARGFQQVVIVSRSMSHNMMQR